MTDSASGSPAVGQDAAPPERMSARVAAAREAAQVRRNRQGTHLYPLRLVMLAIVVIPTVLSKPALSTHGRGLGITLSLVVFVLGILLVGRQDKTVDGNMVTVIGLLVVGGAAVALAALQPQAASELPASAVVLISAIRLPPRTAAAAGVPITAGLGLATGSNSSGSAIAGSVLLCLVLGVLGAFFRQSRSSQDRTELLLAELEDAHDDQARAAASAERARIARELHDVLAHSLSGLSIQLEGARKLAASDGASSELRTVIDRSASLAKQGLVEARNAVGALRDDDLTTVERLPALVEHYQRDIGLPVTLVIEGESRQVPADVSLALYRVTDEALTNVMRHAPGAAAHVVVSWTSEGIRLSVGDEGGAPGAARNQSGGGWGLVGMRERVTLLGGSFAAGPEGTGWCVEVVVPA